MNDSNAEFDDPGTPGKIMELTWGFAPLRILHTAVQLDLFTHLDSGCLTVESLSEATRASARGLKRLLDALTGLSFLIKEGAEYHLAPSSRAYLVKGKPFYLGGLVEHGMDLLRRWERLEEAVRSGSPIMALDQEEKGKDYFPKLVEAIFPLSYDRANEAAKALAIGSKHTGLRILDVAAGSAAWSIPMAERDSEAQITALDFPEVLVVAKERTLQHGVAHQFSYLAGNLRELDFGEGFYDLVILGNICHSEGAEHTRTLFRKTFRSLVNEGRALIAEPLPNDLRSAPPFPLIFGLNMLLHTLEGDVFTFAEYKSWLEEAGFAEVDILKSADNASPFKVILATKP